MSERFSFKKMLLKIDYHVQIGGQRSVGSFLSDLSEVVKWMAMFCFPNIDWYDKVWIVHNTLVTLQMYMANYPHIESWKPVSPLKTTSILLLWKSTEPPWQHFASVPTSLKLRGLDTPNPKFQEMNGYVLFAPTTTLFTLVMNSMLQWSAIPLLAKGVPYSNYLLNNVKTSYI